MQPNHFYIITLNKNLQLNHLIAQLSEYFGLVFLQDDLYPIIAMLPKLITNLDTESSFIRQADFSYQKVHGQPFDLKLSHSQCLQDKPFQGFNGGYIAFFSYDYAAKWQGINIKKTQQPSAFIGEYDIFLKKINDIWQLYIAQPLQHTGYIQNLIAQLQTPQTPTQQKFCLKHPLTARWSKTEYQQAYNKVQDYLYAGDCYQINLTQEFSSTIKFGHLYSVLPDLLALTQAPYAAYLKFENFELLSCSPELFIEFQANQRIKTRPIKGTLPRHSNPQIDQQLKQQLANSEKDQAENLMIVDLLRNDLSIYAKTGSVHVPHLFEIESFAQVHHLVSEIQATLKDDIDVFDVLLAALPGGSITGTPKIRAMQIIEELEGNSRGAYCGSLGYFNYDGTGRFNILIRTIQRYDNQLSVWAGGGITVASHVDAEYQECLDKVSALLNFLNQYVDK